ncbi:kinase-like protein [Lizonia empirigonia]|nr:kinase-like protein [Lizonia empirigonia]
MDEDIHIEAYYPNGVQQIITTGGYHYIGSINETTVLKYPHLRGPSPALDIEQTIFEKLGKHPRIIGFTGKHEDGLLLEYAPIGSLKGYLKEADLTEKERIRFAKETAEGVAHAHRKNILICDINVRNILLDNELHVKLCDFQGRLLGLDGEILYDGGASENAESFMPRHDKDYASVKTDIFALGSTIYHIVTGHQPFPELNTIDDEAVFWDRYEQGHFPSLETISGSHIIRSCWQGEYTSASKVFEDLSSLEACL